MTRFRILLVVLAGLLPAAPTFALERGAVDCAGRACDAAGPAPTTSAGPAPATSAGPAAGQAHSDAPRGRRVALVIGNANYGALPRLRSPAHDAADVAAALRQLGFEATLALDQTLTEMQERLAAFAQTARSSDVALVFFAGHAVQQAGINYLAPVDVSLRERTDLGRLIRLPDIVAGLSGSAQARILIIDAGRDDAEKAVADRTGPPPRSAAGRLTGPDPEGVFVAFSTQAGSAPVDVSGRNSPFTDALLRSIAVPGQDIRVLFGRVRSDVLKATQGRQRPEVADTLAGEFSFN